MKPGMLSRRLAAFLSLLLLCTAAIAPRPALAQAPDAATLEKLVGPIALYPDDLLSITLQGSTYPLQIVEADRWIAANKGKKDAKPKDSWDDSVKALVNYPDVVSKMSTELDWTTALGEAVAADQSAVMDAVQAFRRKADGAGNLKSDDKALVEEDEGTIKIVQADPQVIYVPQYEPTTVVVQQSTPYYPTYYPTPYPCYYCYYPPGYAFASGFFWGAATAAAFDWFGGGIHDIDIDIDRNTNINRNTNRNTNRQTNIDRGKSQQLRQSGGASQWRSNAKPGDVSRGRATQAGSRPATANRAATGQGAGNRAGAAQGGANRAGTAQAGGNRASAGQGAANRGGGTGGGYTRPSGSGASAGSYNRSSSGGTGRYQNAGSYGQSARSSSASRGSYGGGGYSGGSSARSSAAYSSRGASSRGGGMGGGGRGGGGGGRRR